MLGGLARKFSVALTDGTLWQIVGHVLFDATTPETKNVENYSGIGFYARPPAGSASAEAVTVNIGGASTPAIVATRDEATRQHSAGDLEPNESCIFNGLARIRVRNDGIVEIHAVGVTPGPMDFVVVGSGIDSFTGAPYFALGNCSTVVKVQK